MCPTGHTDGDTGRGENGDERRCLDAEDAYYSDYEYEIEKHLHQRQDECGERGFYFAACEDGDEETVEPGNNESPRIEDENSYGEVDGKRHHAGHHFVEQFVERKRFEHRYLVFGRRDRIGQRDRGYLL